LEPLERADAAVRATRPLAIALLEGRLTARDAARRVWDHFLETDYASGPLAAFASLADEFNYSPRVISEDDFRQAAQEFVTALDQAPAG
jgi:hypothetical protein